MLLLVAAVLLQSILGVEGGTAPTVGRRLLGDFLQWPYAWCYLHFVRHYFHLADGPGGWDRFYRWLRWAYLAGLVVVFSRFATDAMIGSWVMLVLNLVNLVGGFVLACGSWRRGVDGAAWFVAANTPLTVAGTLHAVQWVIEPGGTGLNAWFPFWAGIVLQLLIFLAALGARYQRVEQRLRTASAEATEAHQQAVELAAVMRTKDEFIAYISHEVRTPLNAVLGFSRLLDETSLDEDQRSLVRSLNSSGRLLLALVDGVLDLARVDSGHDELDLQPCDVRLVMGDTVDLMRPAAEEKGLVLRCSVDADVAEWVRTDVVRWRQIVLNLTANAVKFTPQGHVQVAVDQPSPELLRLRVTDTGVGVAADRRANLFEPFFQSNPTVDRRAGGCGLGLGIARKLARLLGGEVTYAPLTTAEGGGSAFTATIKIGAVDTAIKGANHA